MSDQVSDIITTLETDDELSSDEEDAVLQLLPFNSPAESLAIIGREGVVMKMNQMMEAPQAHKMQLLAI